MQSGQQPRTVVVTGRDETVPPVAAVGRHELDNLCHVPLGCEMFELYVTQHSISMLYGDLTQWGVECRKCLNRNRDLTGGSRTIQLQHASMKPSCVEKLEL